MSRTVSLLNRFEDPETSSDPRVRALVEKLSRVDYAPAPRPEFRSELRQQLVAIAGRVVTEGEPVAVPSTAGPAMLDPVEAAHAARSDADSAAGSQWASVSKLERPARRRKDSSDRRVRRPVGLAAACVAVLVLGFSGTVWKSRSALPGDSLYGLKRASENVQLDLTTGDTARGHEYLKLATTRVQEAKDLLGQTSALASGSGDQAGGLSPQTVSLIRSTLRSANSDVTSGSSLLGTEAVKSHSARPLTIMTKWAPTELVKLKMLATAIGTGPAHASTLHSWTVVHSALARARTLTPQVTRSCAAAPTDNYGPKSCT
ncbi:DUF5667 domain-containing protein, partial [Jatrophihabitans endophyticus]|uniref:DUF5667 domain-containing protein n=1 Tax=Jatrophihabitans endophyticus TaxID=1206085 RepID=UPI001A0E5542